MSRHDHHEFSTPMASKVARVRTHPQEVRLHTYTLGSVILSTRTSLIAVVHINNQRYVVRDDVAVLACWPSVGGRGDTVYTRRGMS